MKKFLLFIGMAIGLFAQSQTFVETFVDGDLTNPPPGWIGNTGSWARAVNNQNGPDGVGGDGTLRLNANRNVSPATYYLAKPISIWGSFQGWGLWWGRNSSVDANNEQYFWLFADKSNVNDPTINGYRLALTGPVFPGDPDVLQLQKVVAGVAVEVLYDIALSGEGLTDYGFRVRVTRSASNEWNLYTAIDLTTLPLTGGGEPATTSPIGITTFSYGTVIEQTIPYAPIPITGNGYIILHAKVQGTTPMPVSIRRSPEFDQIMLDANGILPVTLESFKAIRDGNKSRLDWKVGIEDNVKGYEVERSSNGVNFSNVGFVSAVGARAYNYTDELLLPGQNFYRLRTVDYDGKYAYSHIVSVNGKQGSFVKVFPNPASDQLYIQHTGANEKAQIKIISMEGRVILNRMVAENSVQTVLNIQAIPAGLYHVVYDYGNGEQMISKFVKQ